MNYQPSSLQRLNQPNASRSPHGSISIFKEEIGQFVVDTFSMIRQNVSQEKSVIEGLIQSLQPKLQNFQSKKPHMVGLQGEKRPQVIGKIQAAVEQLNRQSENLCERLFDLSQQLVRNKMKDFQCQKQKLRQEYALHFTQIKKQFQLQKIALQSELSRCQAKCEVLQKCLNERTPRQNTYKQQQLRKRQLSRYMQIIQELSQQILFLKNSEKKENLYYTEGPSIQSELKVPSEVYSQRQQYRYNDYNQLPYDQLTHISKSTRPPTQYYENEYYQRANNRNTNSDYQRQMERVRARIESVEKAKNYSKEKYLQKDMVTNPRTQLPPKSRPSQQQLIYTSSQENRERGRSIDRFSDGRPRTLVIHTQSTPVSTKLVDSIRKTDNYRTSSQCLRLQQRNSKLEAVQEKLHGLKRTLSKELRNLNY